jgi:hypothetical protein
MSDRPPPFYGWSRGRHALGNEFLNDFPDDAGLHLIGGHQVSDTPPVDHHGSESL